MTTWEERVAHLSERWATSSRPHRNPPPLRLSGESRKPRAPAVILRHVPHSKPTQLQKSPKSNESQYGQPLWLPTRPPTRHPTHAPPSRHSGESRKPRNHNSQEQPGNTSLTATPTPPVFPAKAGNHATTTPRNSPATPAELQLSPLPSFRRKPESTYPQLSKTPSPLQPNGNSHPSRHSNEIRNEARGNVR